MQPLVSVLMPAYNAEPWIQESIESVLAQSWKSLELIIIDDGSQDNTFVIAKQYESPTVKVIAQLNQGQSATENCLLREAQGEFIQYLDADDLIAPDKIERQIQRLGDASSPYIASGEWGRFHQSISDVDFRKSPLWADISPIDWLLCAWENHLMMHGASWLIPRAISERAGFWNENLSLINDFEYFSRILLASEGILFCSGAKSYYRSGNNTSLSASKSRKALESAFLSLELGTQNLLANENSDRTRSVCATVFQRFIYEAYPDAADLREQSAQRVDHYGGSTLKPLGGPTFQAVSNLVGWKTAKRLQQFARR